MREIAVIDYGMCNLDSVYRAIEKCGGKPFITNDPDVLAHSNHIVLPGVGAFFDAMENLKMLNLIEPLQEIASTRNVAILGICLGMQLLATKGTEGRETPGLDLIEGTVVRLQPSNNSERIPHIGWNEVHFENKNVLLDGISSGSDFYFVHSYHFDCDLKYQIATTPFANNFNSVVATENIFGVQFHPEKSQLLGFKVLENFLSI